MNKKRFLQELERQLRHLPPEDRLDALQYYTEYLEEMDIDENADVVAILGTPKAVARDIIGNCTEKHLEEHKEKAGVKNSATLIWLIILGICASPIAMPLLVAAFVVIVVLVSSLFFTGLVVALVGVFCLVISFVALGFFNKLQCIGMGLICISLGILLVFGIIKLSQICVRLIAGLMCARQ